MLSPFLIKADGKTYIMNVHADKNGWATTKGKKLISHAIGTDLYRCVNIINALKRSAKAQGVLLDSML